MKKKSLLWLSAILLMLAGCSSNDDVISNPKQIVGRWMASHHSKNPNSGDTADMWDFTFNADGTGSWPLATRSFRYKIEGNRITLQLMNVEAYYGQTEFTFNIVSHSKDEMEWDEIPNESWNNYGMYLKFYRK